MDKHSALYLKYRPKYMNDLAGQDIVVNSLKKAIANNTTSHAYLFIGPSGVGKTTASYILGYSMNCSNLDSNNNPCYMCESCKENLLGYGDIKEIDSATNRGIDNIKSIIEGMSIGPRFKKKIYVFDEAHMLTDAAWNALLKIVESPPPYVMFIFATTELNKIPYTIITRCQELYFRYLSNETIIEKLKSICANENISYENINILSIISKNSSGSLRNAIKFLEQIINISEYKNGQKYLTLDSTKSLIFSNSSEFISNVYELTIKGKPSEICEFFSENNLDISLQTFDLMYSYIYNQIYVENSSIESSILIEFMNIILECKNKLLYNSSPKFVFELAILKCCSLYNQSNTKSDDSNISTITLNKIELFMNVIKIINRDVYDILNKCELQTIDSSTLLIVLNNVGIEEQIRKILNSNRGTNILKLCNLEKVNIRVSEDNHLIK